MADMPEALGKVSGIDADRAIGCAQAIHSARIYRHVLEVAAKRVVRSRSISRLLQAFHLAPDHDPLPRRERQVAARTLRLAEAALDALVHFGLNHGHLL